jgi:hypothetical protein
MSNFKMDSKKDYGQNIDQMVSIGSHIQKVNDTALRFCKTMILS